MKNRENWRHNKNLSALAFESVFRVLPKEEALEIKELIFEVDEWGLGIETLIDTLVECNIAISPAQKCAIDSAVESMCLDHNQDKLLVNEP